MPLNSAGKLSSPEEERAFASALLEAYSLNELKMLGRDVGLDRQFGATGTTDEEIARDLVDVARRKGKLRRLLRLSGRHTNPELNKFVRQALPRSFNDDFLLDDLRSLLIGLGPGAWETLLDSFRHHFEGEPKEMSVPRWELTVSSELDFAERCTELIEILCEFDRNEKVALDVPLLHFVRDVFCTPLGSEQPGFRTWLTRSAPFLKGKRLADLIIVGWGNPEQIEQMARDFGERLGQTVTVGSHVLEDGLPVTWELLLALPAIKVAIAVDQPGRLNRPAPPAASAETMSGAAAAAAAAAESPEVDTPPRLPNPSYSPILLLTSNLTLPHKLLAEFTEHVPHKVICLQSWSLEKPDVLQLTAAVTGATPSGAPDPVISPDPVPELGELVRDELTMIVGPSLQCMACRTSGLRLAHYLLTTLEAKFDQFHPLLPLDAAAYLFSVKRPPPALTRTVVEWLAAKPTPLPALPAEYLNIARIFKSIVQNGAGQSRKRLIITTNVDLLLERALLWEGVPFTRVVQADKRTVSNRYDVEIDAARNRHFLKDRPAIDLRPDTPVGCAQLENAIRTYSSDQARMTPRQPWEPNDPCLVLYKYHGSIDVPDSLVLSVTDYIRRSTQVDLAIPKDIRSAASNRRWLFLGYTLLDPQLRHLRQTLLPESKRADHIVLHCGLADDCSNLQNLCVERLIWTEMVDRWKEEHFAAPPDVESTAFLHDIIEAAS
jgi:hypothetical protein